MKKISLVFSLVIILLFTGCRKEPGQNLENRPNLRYNSIFPFLQANLPDLISAIDIQSIKPLQYNNQNIGYQVFLKSNSKKFLLFTKHGSAISGNYVDLSGLSNQFSGKIKLTDLKNKRETDLIVENTKIIGMKSWDNSNFKRKLEEEITLEEVIIVGEGRDVYWNMYGLSNRNPNFKYYYFAGNREGKITGGRGNSNNERNNVIVLPVYKGPKSPIKNLADELKCLTVSPNSTYTISVNVNQPRPNSRDKVDPSNDFMVGHAFLSLEQTKADGSVIIRNIGYYPQTSVYPGKYTDHSVFGEDSETPISVSLNISVSGDEMSTVVNSLIFQQSVFYDLENANCASSIVSTLDKINIQLPSTSSGIYNLFKGLNPGDLGQDIRNLDLNKFGKDNGNRKVVRSTSEKNDLKPTPKKGSC